MENDLIFDSFLPKLDIEFQNKYAFIDLVSFYNFCKRFTSFQYAFRHVEVGLFNFQ